ncbi:hypothetical protein UlMin_029544 [Ulmus minor]
MGLEANTSKSPFLNNIYAIFGKYEENTDVEAVSIFKVPHSLCSTKPETYIPHEVGLGPYHHLRSELQHRQMYKLVEAKRILKRFNTVGFEKLVDLLQENVVPSVRALYNTYLDMEDEDLACIMAIDGLFLLQLLCLYGKDVLSHFTFFRDLASSGAWRLAKDSTLRDAMTLENQIPMLVMKVVLIVECTRLARPNNDLEIYVVMHEIFPRILLEFCKTISPLSVWKHYPRLKILRHHHLLDLLYHLIILKDLSGNNSNEEQVQEAQFIKDTSEKVKNALIPKQHKEEDEMGFSLAQSEILSLLAPVTRKMLSAPLDDLGSKMGKFFQVVESLSGLPFQRLISSILDLATREAQEDVLVPRASKLYKARVIFCEDNHFTNINFNSKTKSLHLPVIRLNVNSEIIIRNLVVYETMIKSESKSHLLTRYLELMSGLIQTSEDVKVLTDYGIIKKSGSIDDEEIAKMFNEMGKPINLTNPLKGIYDEQDPLEKAIKDVKSYYDDSWKVSAGKFIKKWGRRAWKLIKFLAVLVIFLLFAAQSVCTVYDCSASNHLKYTPRLQGISLGRKLNWI